MFNPRVCPQEQTDNPMTQENQRQDVAVFVDFENVYISVRDKLDANPNFETIMERCTELGRIVIARAYADWYRYPRITSALYANGIDPIYVPTYHYTKDTGRTGGAIKNSADMHLCIDAMKTLFMHANIGKYVFITGDRDFIPLVNSIRQQGKDVIIIGIGGAASTHLAQSADEFIFYEQLVGKSVSVQRSRAVSDSSKLDAVVEADIYDTLVQAVHLVRERGYVSTLGSLKLVMKELMGGDFKESRYKDLKGRPFTKFKDFVLDAEKRGKVQIYTSGTVNEVFLPGEDAARLSQFSDALKESSENLNYTTADLTNGRKEKQSSEPQQETLSSSSNSTSSRSRRRRRPSRNKQQNGESQPYDTIAPAAKSGATEATSRLDDLEREPEPTTASSESQDRDHMLHDTQLHEDQYEDETQLDQQRTVARDDISYDEWDEGTPDDVLMFDDLQHYDTDDEMFSDEQLLRQWERVRSLLMESESRSQVDVDEVFASVSSSDTRSSMDESDLFAKARALLAASESKQEGDTTEQAQEDDTATSIPEQFFDTPAEPAPVMGTDLDSGALESSGDEPDPASLAATESDEHQPGTAMAMHADSQTEEVDTAEALHTTSAFAPLSLEEQSPEHEQRNGIAQALPDTSEEVKASADAETKNTTDESEATGIMFSDEEWQIFRTMMSGFPKPVSFGHMFDALRDLRNQQQITRTNEQLRSMIKQAINNGLLDRSGRGMRIYYRLAEEA